MEIPVTWVSWGLAVLPIIVLLVLMLGRRWGVAEAGPVGLLIAALVAWFYFDAPLDALGYGAVSGTWSAVTVLFVVWASILIYEVSHEADAFQPLREGITRLMPNPLIQVLAFGWAFASFLQGVTGFGVPIAVCAPLLVGMGVRPLYAVIIPLIGHAWNNTFGTLAVAWLALKEVTGISGAEAVETALYAAAFIWVLNFLGGVLVCWIYDRWRGVKDGFLIIVIMSLIQGGGTLLLAPITDVLNGFIASTAAFIVLFGLARLPVFRKSKPYASHIFNDKVRQQPGQATAETTGARQTGSTHADSAGSQPATEGSVPHASASSMTLNQAAIPYYALLIITFVVLLIPPIKNTLGSLAFGIDIPSTVTGLGIMADSSSKTFAVFIHAGTFLLAAALISHAAYAYMGRMQGMASTSRIWRNTADKAVPSTIAVVALIAMSDIMSRSGAIEVLSHGVAMTTGSYYGLLAPLVGGLGAFITSSNMASNLLFGSFQASTAKAAGLLQSAILGAQTAGGAAGNMIAPGNVLLGTTTTGILGREGDVLRVTIPLFILVSLIIGVVVFIVA